MATAVLGPDRAQPAGLAGLAAAPVAGVVRLACVLALGFYGLEHWVTMVAPADHATSVQATLVAAGLAAALVGMRRVRLGRWGRAALGTGLLVVALALVLAACGVPVRLFGPRAWDELFSGIGQGLQALPALRIPYRGVDPWTRSVVLAGGALLLVLAVALAFWPARGGRGTPLGAAVALGVLYGVPVVERGPDHPFLDGAVFAIGLAAVLWADRLTRAQAPIALGLGTLAVLLSLLVAPRLDGDSSWIDYQHLTDGLTQTSRVSFSWDHRYSPLDWPRDGHEVLRVSAKRSDYWKAVVLDDFDGLRWDQLGRARSTSATPGLAAHPDWRTKVRVVVRDLRSEQILAPGTLLSVNSSKAATVLGIGTGQLARKPLVPGDSYTAEVYSPAPTTAELKQSGDAFGYASEEFDDLTDEVAVRLPLTRPVRSAAMSAQRRPLLVEAPLYGRPGTALSNTGLGAMLGNGNSIMEKGPYADTWRLAQRLREQSTSLYDLVQRVQRRVQSGARYSETPKQHKYPLQSFLFEDRVGYCQHFSGAMALLLRMAGVPSRVASGFAPGSYDGTRREYVVRDTDAHSWVEVYFPGIGWTTFDPTPAAAPALRPRSTANSRTPAPATQGAGGSDRVSDPGAGGGAAPSSSGGGGGSVWPELLAAVVAALAGGAALLWRRARRRDPQPVPGEPAPLAELRRALARSGRPLATDSTLAGVEQRLAGSPAAEGYVRALRLSRYGSSPPDEQALRPGRRALRRELAEGLGLRGRLRSLWALPPRRPRRRAA